jgi:hypothetical protein
MEVIGLYATIHILILASCLLVSHFVPLCQYANCMASSDKYDWWILNCSIRGVMRYYPDICLEKPEENHENSELGETVSRMTFEPTNCEIQVHKGQPTLLQSICLYIFNLSFNFGCKSTAPSCRRSRAISIHRLQESQEERNVPDKYGTQHWEGTSLHFRGVWVLFKSSSQKEIKLVIEFLWRTEDSTEPPSAVVLRLFLFEARVT